MHVHGEHDHAVEHEAHKSGLGQQVALFSAILATVGAIVSMLGGQAQNTSLYKKNEAVLFKTQASNEWAYFQAKSTKQALAELAASTANDAAVREKFAANVKRYDVEKEEIKKRAEALEKKSEEANQAAEHALHPHHKLEISMTLLQIAIALASITVLTKKRWLFVAAGVAALIGAGLGGLAYL